MPNERTDRVPEIIGDLMAAMLSTGAGPLVGAAARAPLVELAQRSWNEIRGRQAANAGSLLSGASLELGTTPESVAATALSDPSSSQLLYESLRAATDTLNAEKVD